MLVMLRPGTTGPSVELQGRNQVGTLGMNDAAMPWLVVSGMKPKHFCIFLRRVSQFWDMIVPSCAKSYVSGSGGENM